MVLPSCNRKENISNFKVLAFSDKKKKKKKVDT